MFSSSWCVKRPKNRPTFQRNFFQRAELLIYSALQLHADTLKYKTRSPCQMHLSGCFPVATLEKESGLRWSSAKVPSAGKTVSSNASSEAPATSVCREECWWIDLMSGRWWGRRVSAWWEMCRPLWFSGLIVSNITSAYEGIRAVWLKRVWLMKSSPSF